MLTADRLTAVVDIYYYKGGIIMSELRQTGFGEEVPRGGIAAPGEPHMACVLLLDTSSSMTGAPISSLNKAINDFKTQLVKQDWITVIRSLDQHTGMYRRDTLSILFLIS